MRMKLVEEELWQREEKGLIGILPVRDAAAKTTSAGSPPSPGELLLELYIFQEEYRNQVEGSPTLLFLKGYADSVPSMTKLDYSYGNDQGNSREWVEW